MSRIQIEKNNHGIMFFQNIWMSNYKERLYHWKFDKNSVQHPFFFDKKELPIRCIFSCFLRVTTFEEKALLHCSITFYIVQCPSVPPARGFEVWNFWWIRKFLESKRFLKSDILMSDESHFKASFSKEWNRQGANGDNLEYKMADSAF